MKLTHASAKSAPAGSVLRDDEVKGLQLRVTHTRRSWYLRYFTRDGRERRPKLGDFPEMNLVDARRIAKELKQQVAAGADPSADWKENRAAATVADLCDKFLSEWAPEHKRASSIKSDALLISAQIKPGLGSKRVADVTRADVDAFLKDVRERRFVSRSRRWVKKEAPGAANHVRALLSKLFNLAMYDFGMRTQLQGNPVKGSRKNTVRKRRRVATPAELRAIGVELRRLEPSRPAHVAALVALCLTGARVGEIERAKRRYLQGDCLVIDDHKTVDYIGPKIIHLPPLALGLIQRLPATTSDGRLFGKIQLREVWDNVRQAAGCPDLQMLDLRRTFASFTLRQGVGLDQIGDLFGHTDTKTTRGYAWLADENRRRIATTGADAISSAAGFGFGDAGPAPRLRVRKVRRRLTIRAPA